MIPIKGKYSTAYIMVDDPNHVVEPEEYAQALQFVNCHVFTEDSRIMPDYHYGNGCMIGFTAPMTYQVIPNVVGVDLFCNMMYVSFQKRYDWSWADRESLDRALRERLPTSYRQHKQPVLNFEHDFPWALATLQQETFTRNLNKKFGTDHKGAAYTSKWFFELCERVDCKSETAVNSIGTLGGGNHFGEFSNSERTGNTGVTLHSGSRNLGAKIATYWQKKAKANLKHRLEVEQQGKINLIKTSTPMDQWNELIKAIKLPSTPIGLEYLEGDDWYGYLHDINFAKVYSKVNLQAMMHIVLDLLGLSSQLMLHEDTVHTVHNCIDLDDFIIRKGAVKSIKGERMLIPFNMEDGILICEGKSNPEYYNSAPHGAGRMYGRKEIKKRSDVNTRDIKDRMKKSDIYISSLPKDEVKEAYKDPKFIEEALAPTATIIDRLIPIWAYKANK